MTARGVKRLAVLISACCAVAQAAEFYVAPGATSGDGSFGRPWDLATALNHPSAVKPGDTVWLRGGVYKGTYISNLTGTASAPVTLRGYTGERAIIDGSLAGQTYKNVTVLQVDGAYVWLRDIEITNSDPQRTISVSGSNPPERRGTGLDIRARGVKAINLIIHDTGQGLSSYGATPDLEVYGCLIYSNGWDAPDRGHGHGIYAQNNTGTKLFADNVILQTFGDSMHVYGSSAAYLRDFSFIGNVMHNGRLLFGGNTPIERMLFDSNMTYNGRLEFGYGALGNYGLTATNNYVMGGISFTGWNDFRATNNTFYASVNDGSMKSVAISASAGVPFSKYIVDRNVYYQSNPNLFDFRTSTILTFTQWKALGFDAASTYISTADTNRKPTGVKVFVRRNKYDADRSLIAIYNWSLGSTVPVDVSGVLAPGDSYELHNTLNYFGDVIKGTYAGGSMFVPMVNRTMAPVVGYSQLIPGSWNTFPEFGSFILIRKSVAAKVTPPTVSLGPGRTQQFAATVTNTTNTGVTWSLSPGVGTISTSGLYTAPSTITSPQTVTVTATSVVNGAVTAKATVQLTPPVTVKVMPATVSLGSGRTQQFAATVTNTTSTAVVWSLSPAVGTISTTGLYTAPAAISSAQTITVTATSVANGAVSAKATVQLAPPAPSPITVTIKSASSSVVAGGKLQFSATVTGTSNTAVTWSIYPWIGSISAAGLYTAPSSVAVPTSISVTARSAASPLKTAMVQITVLPNQSGVPGASAQNLLNDGDFEYGGQNWRNINVFGQVVSTGAYSGTQALQVAGLPGVQSVVAQRLTATGGQTYTLSAWLKTQNVTKSGDLKLLWLDSQGRPLRTDAVGTVSGTTAWTNSTAVVIAPDSAAVVQVQIFLAPESSTARLWVDNLVLL